MSGSFLDTHDAILLDLDGTVYRGGELLPGASEAIESAHRRGVGVRYVTNNASKAPRAVADHLIGLGLEAKPDEVSTSAQAGAAVLADNVPAGARVLVVGAPALVSEVDSAGLVSVRQFKDQPEAIVQGHSPETAWGDLAEACLAIRHGAFWVACNGDLTLPTELGELPGNGAMVAALRAATGREPVIAGKPEQPLLTRAIVSTEAREPLMVGDRLDTDIAGAARSGVPSLMVLTGVNTAADVLFAPPGLRPDHIAADLSALQSPAEDSVVAEHPHWKVRVEGASLELASNSTETAGASLRALRALCAAWWSSGSGPVDVQATDTAAQHALRELGVV